MTPRIETIDHFFKDTPGLIASYLIYAPEGHVLVESGPGSTLPALMEGLRRQGLQPADIDFVLLTHIHFDHAGSAGWWAQHDTTVCVHEVGAPHLIDPSRLISSASRIYGDQMKSLWGKILPAPAENVRALADGDIFEAAGLSFQAIDTPGHASHHHVYRLGDIGFVGDAMGIHGGSVTWMDIPAPPPEFNLEVWKQTLEKLRSEKFETIYRTHFGPRSDVLEEIDRVERLLDASADKVREMQEAGVDRDAMVERYRNWMRARAVSEGGDSAAVREERLNPREMSVDGIARYWTKKAAQG